MGVPFLLISQANPTVVWTALSIGESILLPPQPTGIPQVTGNLALPNVGQSINETTAENGYHFLSGDGSYADGWPDVSDWLSFDKMWDNLQPSFGQNCIGNVQGNTPDETTQVKAAITFIGNLTYVDPRFILAVVMQESTGCVRVPTTGGLPGNPGLMQSDQGEGTCNSNGSVLMPCPCASIYQMVYDGTAGSQYDATSLVNMLNKASSMPTDNQAQIYYRSARLYNSGPYSLQNTTDLGSPGATRCYASDIANRLLGWVVEPNDCLLGNKSFRRAQRRLSRRVVNTTIPLAERKLYGHLAIRLID